MRGMRGAGMPSAAHDILVVFGGKEIRLHPARVFSIIVMGLEAGAGKAPTSSTEDRNKYNLS